MTLKMQLYDIPETGGGKVQCPMTEEELISDEEQSEFRSGVGSLLYLLKHSRPDLSNSVCELTKVMDGANKAHQKMLHWNLKAYNDSDYAGDADTRKSVSGFMIYVNGCLIAWKSKGQKSVTLSSTEAKYVAISEESTEILFIAGVMKFLGMNFILLRLMWITLAQSIYQRMQLLEIVLTTWIQGIISFSNISRKV